METLMMKKFSIVIMVKREEPGLLAISDGRSKSIIPVFDGARIIDYYLAPFVALGFKSMFVVLQKDMTPVMDHIVYHYSAGKVRMLQESNALLKLFRMQNTEKMLFLRADGVFIADWSTILRRLFSLDRAKVEIIGEDGTIIGYYIQDSEYFKKLGGWCAEQEGRGWELDRAWAAISNYLDPKTKKLKCTGHLFGLRTVVEYYDAHFELLRDMEMYISARSSLPGIEGSNESVSQIGNSGFAKDSILSQGCSIDGYVEHSILFSNVRVGKNAKVINSIVMEDNYIGEGAVVLNSIICDSSEFFSKVSPNIGEGAHIGEIDRTGSNSESPRFIHKGITLIGRNVEIPKDFKVSRNCFIASNIDRSALKEMKMVKAGDSVLVP
jgi:ADP-glucose pyrophosphorylase